MAKRSPNQTKESTSGAQDVTVREFLPGQKVFQRYTLVRVLGRGGMGIVWLARDEELERNVALKFLPEMIVHDPAILADLKRETRRSLELTHPHIVRIHDFVQDANSACISMEYVDGDTLSALRATKPNKVFEAPELEAWLGQWCGGMDYAHNDARVVHCDLKPSNLMVNSRGLLKITDFGIARSLSDSATKLTAAARRHSGTLVYMSPQQLDGERPSHLDDVYSMGASLYELLTSKPPFYRGQIDRQIRERIPLPMALRREELEVESPFVIPQIWEETVAACLAKNPAHRPRSAGELAQRLLLTRSIQDRPKVKAPTQAVLRESKKRRARNWFPTIIKVSLTIFKSLRQALASIRERATKLLREPILYFSLSIAALLVLAFLLYLESPWTGKWTSTPVPSTPEPAERPPAPTGTVATSTSSAGLGISSVSPNPVDTRKIPYSSEDVDNLINYVHSVSDSGKAAEQLQKLQQSGSGDDLTSAGLLAEIALLYEAEHDLGGAEEAWSAVRHLGPSSGALYELANRKLKELPPESRPDRGLQPSRESREETSSSTSSDQTPPVLSPSPEIAMAPIAPEQNFSKNSRTWQAWIGDFVREFVSTNQLKDANATLALYAPTVDYFDDHQKDQAYIRTDIEKYNERWPIRRDSVEGDINLQEIAPDRQYSASFKLNFYAESPARAVWTKGQFAIDLDISVTDGAPRISGIKEKVLNQQRGKPSSLSPNTITASPVRYPYGIAVPGRPGIVKSPYASSRGYLDVRRYRKGAQVKCPYTGKVFLVP